VTRSMVVTLPRPVPCTAVRWCAWNLVNIKHRPGVVGAYKTSAERYRPFSFCDLAKEKCQSCISRCMDNRGLPPLMDKQSPASVKQCVRI
jgi:hypothetical protein